MLPRGSRCTSIAAAAFLAATTLVALAGSSAHAGHGCLVDQDCLACRWAADSVALAPTPPVLFVPEGVGLVSPAAPDRTARLPRTPGRSRAPPRG